MKHLVCAHCGAANRLPEQRLTEQPEAARCGVCHQPLLDGTPIVLTAANFQQHLRGTDLAIVADFWAPWCGPCQRMAPVFEKTAAALRGKARFVKVNTETEQALAAQFSIRSIPTLILFKNGRETERMAGALDGPHLRAWVERGL